MEKYIMFVHNKTNIAMMFILLQLAYGFNTISIKISAGNYLETRILT